MYIAIEGCCHGELDKIYETLQFIENKEKIEISLLLCCGDFQSIRNEADLHCMAVPDKHKSMQDFWQYYSGTKTAPYLTIFIGGNHEGSNYLQELPYGGWVAPNIYYLGYSGVVNYRGLRIGGLSGIFKQRDYTKGHYEIPPYSEDTKRSVYHIRHVEVFRLKQLKQPIDVMMSHDWPNGIVNHGNKEELLRKKRHFEEDVRNSQLGSLPSWTLLTTLRPKYWFSGHLHVKFAAKVEHQPDPANTSTNTVTKFLALDKCLPRRDFLQVLHVDSPDNASGELEYDAEWLAVLKNTNHLVSTSYRSVILPTAGLHEKWDFSVDKEKIAEVMKIMGNDLKIPHNFCKDESCIYNPEEQNPHQSRDVVCRINEQTTQLCEKLSINDPIVMIQTRGADKSFDSSWMSEYGEEPPSAIISNVSINPDEIDLDDDEEDDEADAACNEDVAKNAEGSENVGEASRQQNDSCMSSTEEETEPDKDLQQFKTPMRLAAKFTMNLPSPTQSSFATSDSSSWSAPRSGDETPFSPVTSSSDSDSVKREKSSCAKRPSDTDSDMSEDVSATTQLVGKKFKRRNASFYASQSEDDTT